MSHLLIINLTSEQIEMFKELTGLKTPEAAVVTEVLTHLLPPGTEVMELDPDYE